MSDNLKLWQSVEQTDPRHTKSFNGKGGFKGTAISPMWLIRKATELWGPMGGKWGLEIEKEELLAGAPLLIENKPVGQESIHVTTARLFYPLDNGERGYLPCVGQTQFVGVNKYGFYTDEEAPKKSRTDALTKGLSWLGFAADVHMGLYDDVKYVNRVTEEVKKESRTKLRAESLSVLEGAARQGLEKLRAAYKTLSEESRQAVADQNERLKAMAEAADRKEGRHAAAAN